jgi:hypothetical protein
MGTRHLYWIPTSPSFAVYTCLSSSFPYLVTGEEKSIRFRVYLILNSVAGPFPRVKSGVKKMTFPFKYFVLYQMINRKYTTYVCIRLPVQLKNRRSQTKDRGNFDDFWKAID